MNPSTPHPQRHSIRLPGYDYTQPGGYFITIVTQGQRHYFGQINNHQMTLNDLGKIAASEWERLLKRFHHIELDAFVVMPNHIHGIIIIINDIGAQGLSNGVSTENPPPTSKREKFGTPVSGSIPTIIRSYKSSVTQRYRLMYGSNAEALWQRNYYERVIHNHDEWAKIRSYIETNPLHWDKDGENR